MFASRNRTVSCRPTTNNHEIVNSDRKLSSWDLKEIKKDYSRLNKVKVGKANCRVAYIIDDKLLEAVERIPSYGVRNKMVASLIEAYNMHPEMRCIQSELATDEELMSFHSSAYIEFMKKCQTEELELETSIENEFGLDYDCPLLKNQYELVCRIAGGTLTAARQLTSKTAQVAINWCGGWHHAQRDEAEGFCYVNDIVIGIEELRREFPRVLYVDFDIHHGNGVENAYAYTSRVFTLSFHKFEPGFYPTTGSLEDVGKGPGRHFCANIPLSEGLTDADLCSLYDKIVPEVKKYYKPDAVVLQCGADCLTKDPIGSFNLTSTSLAHCVKDVLTWNIPTLVLGGGGYNMANTARCWTYLTSVICNIELSDDIPEHEYFSAYGPGFDLEITPGNIQNSNNNLEEVVKSVLTSVANICKDTSDIYDFDEDGDGGSSSHEEQ